jgi:hypothetical protein
MRGDFTRDTRERARRAGTRAVLVQQGRPLTDADLNEQSGLVADRTEAIVRHVVGLRGAPRDDAGFAITPTAGGFTIGAGSLYVEGLPLNNAAPVAYDAQFPAGLLPALASAIPDNQEALIYVEALLRPSLAAGLSDPALDGVDTAVREIAGWAVRAAPLAGIGMARDALIEALDRDQVVDIVPWRGTTGGLDADVDTQNSDPGPCEIAATAGYLDQLNRLYRVEIHDGGAPGTATFKWTEDASREASLRASGAGFVIDLPQARLADWFPTGTIVEVIDDDRARAGLTGPIGAITSSTTAQLAIAGVPASALGDRVRVRRWAAMPAPVPAAGAWAPLSKGIRVRFASGDYQPGAAWTIPARTVLGDIAWPPYQTPDKTETVGTDNVGFYAPLEGRRRHAALALVRRNGANFTVTADLRDLFPPLTDLTADVVRYDDSTSGLGATNVQQAIDELARRGGDCCTWHARPSTDLQALVDSIPARANGVICFATGNYDLAQPLRIAGKGHIRLIGAGPGSKLWLRGGAQALVIDDCLSLEVADLLVAAEAPGAPAQLGKTAGALDITNTGPVRVWRTTLIAQGRRWKQSAALRVACLTKPGGGDVSVENCDLVVGDLGSGIIVLDSRTLRIENNRIRPRDEPIARTLDRWLQDKYIAAAVGRLSLSHALPGNVARPVPPTRIDTRLFAAQKFTVGDNPIALYASTLVSGASFTALRTLLQQEMPSGDSRKYRLRMRELASNILAHAGRVKIAKQDFNGFLNFYNIVSKLVAPVIDAAIVVGGNHANDVTVTGNRIEGALRGVRVAVNAGVPQQRLPLGTLRVERNHIRLRVVPADVARHGIYVGNAERAWLADNDIAGETADGDFGDPRKPQLLQNHFDALHGEGIRVVGTLGPMIQIRGNIVRSCPFAYTVTRTAGTDTRPKLWLLQGNYADGGVTPYRLDAACRKVDCL